MKPLKLPRDLRIFVTKAVLKRVVPCLLLLVTFSVALIFWGDVILPIEKEIVKVIVYTMVMLVPFVVTGVPHKMIDSTWVGEVLETKIVEENSFTNEVRPRMYGSVNVILNVKMPNGKTKEIKLQGSTFAKHVNLLFAASGNANQTEDFYSVGNTVFHLYSSSQYIVLPKAADKTVQCPICGIKNDKTHEKCDSCGHSLIID